MKTEGHTSNPGRSPLAVMVVVAVVALDWVERMLSVDGMVEKWLLGSAASGACRRVLRALRGSVYKKEEN